MTNANRVFIAPLVLCLLMAANVWAVETGGSMGDGQAPNASPSRIQGQGQTAEKSLPGDGAPSRQGKSKLIRNIIFKTWEAIGVEAGEGWGGKPSCACSGMAGNCPEGSDVCRAIGKTWEQLTQPEKKALCDGIRKRIDQERGQGESSSVSAAACEGCGKEPDWEQVMAKLGPLLQTTKD